MTNKHDWIKEDVSGAGAAAPARLVAGPMATEHSGPNRKFSGAPGSRHQLATPCLILELEPLQANIDKMSSLVAGAGKRLRPHAKAHKCVEIARRQIRAGAIGISVATIGEAEVFYAGGISDIFITSTFAPGTQIDRVIELVARGCRLAVVLDNIEVAKALGGNMAAANSRINVYIDIDMGRKRSGCASLEDAVALAAVIAGQPSLELAGLQAYAGHLSHMAEFEARRTAAIKCQHLIAAFKQALADFSRRDLICTGGSTGSLMLDLSDAVLDELQYGSYVFMDAEYLAVDPDGTSYWPFKPSLFVRTTVISANAADVVTTDGGDKRFANKYGALPKISDAAFATSIYRPISDEHGQIELHGGAKLAVGDAVECLIPHSDPTVNLFNQFHVVAHDRLLDIWPVDARGVF